MKILFLMTLGLICWIALALPALLPFLGSVSNTLAGISGGIASGGSAVILGLLAYRLFHRSPK